MATANIQTTDKDQKPLVSLPDQNVVDLLISLAASFGLEVTRSATKRPLPMNSEERKPSGKVVVHGHRTKSLFARELQRFRRLRDRYFAGALFAARSEARSVGKEWFSTGRSRGSTLR